MAHKVHIDNFDRSDWERYAKEFADYSIYQTWAYQEHRAEVDGQDISRALVINEQGDIQTMCQVRIKHIKVLGLKIGYVQWGPLMQGKNRVLKCPGPALRVLRDAYIGRKMDVLRLVPNAWDNESGERISEMLLSNGFRHVPSFPPYKTLMLRVDDCEEGILKRLRKSFRRDLRYGWKAGVETCESQDEEFCEILEKLYHEALIRKGFKGLDPSEFIEPQQNLSPEEKISFIVANHEGKAVSAYSASNLGDTSLVLLVASSEKALSCFASYVIWYAGAVSACRARMKWCDLGGIDPEKNPNVYQFKTRMGSKKVRYIGAFDAWGSWYARISWKLSDTAYRLIKRKTSN